MLRDVVPLVVPELGVRRHPRSGSPQPRVRWTPPSLASRADPLEIGAIVHDLASPVAAIRMLAASVLAQSALAGQDAAKVRQIADSSGRLADLIEQLFDLVRTEMPGAAAARGAWTDLAVICRQVVDECRACYPSREIRVDLSGRLDGPWDGGRLARVLSNLLMNALQHGESVGPVTVTGTSSRAYVRLDVHNQGPPILRRLRRVLFEPFCTGGRPLASGPSAGLGLGLYIARAIVRRHGGTISVRSSEAGGTAFTVRLPRGVELRRSGNC